jgi:hypothetical protein
MRFNDWPAIFTPCVCYAEPVLPGSFVTCIQSLCLKPYGGEFKPISLLRGSAMSELLLLREVFNLIVGGRGSVFRATIVKNALP